MTKRTSSCAVWFLVVAQSTAIGQEASAPEDQPFSIEASEMARFEGAIQPFVQMGRDTFAAAKEKYLSGLPRDHLFYVTLDLIDSDSRTEQVFVFVDSIEDGTITGRIASEIFFVSGFERGDDVSFPENNIKDWTISRPDGSEEGNFVGRFLDHYRPGRLFAAVFEFTVSQTGQAQGISLELVANDSGERVNVDLPPGWIEAAGELIRMGEWPPPTEPDESIGELYLPLIYDPDRPDEPLSVEQ